MELRFENGFNSGTYEHVLGFEDGRTLRSFPKAG